MIANRNSFTNDTNKYNKTFSKSQEKEKIKHYIT